MYKLLYNNVAKGIRLLEKKTFLLIKENFHASKSFWKIFPLQEGHKQDITFFVGYSDPSCLRASTTNLDSQNSIVGASISVMSATPILLPSLFFKPETHYMSNLYFSECLYSPNFPSVCEFHFLRQEPQSTSLSVSSVLIFGNLIFNVAHFKFKVKICIRVNIWQSWQPRQLLRNGLRQFHSVPILSF